MQPQPRRSLPNSPPGAGFRVFWACATVLAWAVFVILIGHHSGTPVFFGRYSPAYASFLVAVLQRHGPVTVEVTASWFANGSIGRWFNSAVDQHPNAEAHALAAQNILASLRAQGLLPEASSAAYPR